MNARVALHSAKEVGPFAFSLAPDARAQLVQDLSGVVRVTRAITDYQDDGVTPVVITQTEFIVGRPILRDSSRDPAAVATGGAVTMTLAPAPSGGQQQVALAVDRAWLQDTRRVFPVHLDLPITTAESAVHSGTFGTVNSCAPDAPALQADIVVGAEGGCTYHGQVLFNLTSLLYDTPIVSATLRLHTPDQTGLTDVQVYSNTSPATDTLNQPAAWEQPSWNSAPAIAPGATGVAQGAISGHEQTWDVTSLVRQWVQNPKTNGGFTLVGAGAPVRFSSALGAGSGKPGDAPSLDIMYGPRPLNPAFVDRTPHLKPSQQAPAVAPNNPAVAPNNDAGASSIYGVAGDFTADYTQGPSGPQPYPNCGQRVCSGALDENVVAQGQTAGIGGSYVRIGVSLKCVPTQGPVDVTWWNTTGANPTNVGAPADLIYTAAQEHLIPVIDSRPPTVSCYSLSPLQWAAEAQNFLDYMQTNYPHNATIYFEVGNEWNTAQNYRLYYTGLYYEVFGAVAQGLQSTLNSYGFTNYHVLTGGVLDPTSYENYSGSCTDTNGKVNITDTANAINNAESRGCHRRCWASASIRTTTTPIPLRHQ